MDGSIGGDGNRVVKIKKKLIAPTSFASNNALLRGAREIVLLVMNRDAFPFVQTARGGIFKKKKKISVP